MNTPDNLPVDVAEQRAWLNQHKADSGSSWTLLAQQIGIASGTLSVFATDKYQGDNDRIAREIYRHRQYLTTQAELDTEAPVLPGYIETPTSRRLQSLLQWAHRGRMVAAACGPGIGKTISSENYRDAVSNVWLVVMRPSTGGMNGMLISTLAALGDRGARGSNQALSDRVIERVTNTNGLIIFDEAQHLTERAIEEVRSWHDATGVGIAFFGNATVLARIEGGARKAAFAQLYSRIAMRHTQNLPSNQDVEVIAAAWGIEDMKQLQFCIAKAKMPGGLRSVTMLLELATMIAASEGKVRTLKHMQDAWAQLVSRPMGGDRDD